VHKESGGTYGALRVTAELKYGRGISVGHNAVGDIMRRLGRKGLPRRRLPRGTQLRAVTSLDLVGRKFRRDRPNELWVTDITEHPTREGKVYCCVVLTPSAEGSWAGRSTPPRRPASCSTRWEWRPDRNGLVMHSDRGVLLGLKRSSQHRVVQSAA
jgi:putative transposase